MSSYDKLIRVSFTYEGRRYYIYGRTKAEAREKAAAKKALLKAHVKTASGDQSVRQWANKWLYEYKCGTVNEKWYSDMQWYIDNAISPYIGNMPLKTVKPIDITRVLNATRNKSESYARKVLLILRQIFSSAEENDLIIKDPARHVKPPKHREKTDRRTITPFERDLTLKTVYKYPKDGIFILIMLYCGCRPGEVAALTRKDFDLERGVLHITKALKSDGTYGKPKSKAGVRDVPVPDIIKEYIEQMDLKPNDLVCTNLHGERLSKTSVVCLWKRFKREMEIEAGTKTFRNALVNPILPDDLVPYCYRHTYCTDLQDAGVPLAVASRLMGHTDISLTARIYTHHSEESFQDAAERINSHSKCDTLRANEPENVEISNNKP